MEWYTKEMKDLEKDLHVVDLVNNLRGRIAELEAELAMTKVREKNLRERVVCADDVRMHTVVQGVAVQPATEFEEGEG